MSRPSEQVEATLRLRLRGQSYGIYDYRMARAEELREAAATIKTLRESGEQAADTIKAERERAEDLWDKLRRCASAEVNDG